MSTIDTQSPFLAAVIFGVEQSTKMSEGRITREVVDAMVERRFATEAERNAYWLGVGDATGNQDFYPLDEDEYARLCERRESMARRKRSAESTAATQS